MDTTLLLVVAVEFILVTISVLIVIFRLVPDIAAADASEAADASIEGENTLLDSATTDPWLELNYLAYYPEAAMMGFIPWVYIPSHYHSAPAPSPVATAKVSEVATAKPSRVLAESVS